MNELASIQALPYMRGSAYRGGVILRFIILNTDSHLEWQPFIHYGVCCRAVAFESYLCIPSFVYTAA